MSAPALASDAAVLRKQAEAGVVLYLVVFALFSSRSRSGHARCIRKGRRRQSVRASSLQPTASGRAARAARCRRRPRLRLPARPSDSGRPKSSRPPMPSAAADFGFLHRFIDGEVEDAGHRANFAADAFAGAEEQRIDQCAGLEMGFADQAAHGLIAAQTPQPGDWVFHKGILTGRPLRRVTSHQLSETGD